MELQDAVGSCCVTVRELPGATSRVCDELGLSVLAATSCSCVVSTKGELAGLMDGGATGEDDGVQGGAASRKYLKNDEQRPSKESDAIIRRKIKKKR
jgi:hypothetical protein